MFFILLEYSCLLLESIFVIYQSECRLIKVMIQKIAVVVCHPLSAVPKYQKLWKLKSVSGSFSDNAWPVLIRGRCSLWFVTANIHMFCHRGAAPKTLLGMVCNMQCMHHIALWKFKVFWIPNHIWTQRLWIRDCPKKIWKIWTDFCPVQLCVLWWILAYGSHKLCETLQLKLLTAPTLFSYSFFDNTFCLLLLLKWSSCLVYTSPPGIREVWWKASLSLRPLGVAICSREWVQGAGGGGRLCAGWQRPFCIVTTCLENLICNVHFLVNSNTSVLEVLGNTKGHRKEIEITPNLNTWDDHCHLIFQRKSEATELGLKPREWQRNLCSSQASLLGLPFFWLK